MKDFLQNILKMLQIMYQRRVNFSNFLCSVHEIRFDEISFLFSLLCESISGVNHRSVHFTEAHNNWEQMRRTERKKERKRKKKEKKKRERERKKKRKKEKKKKKKSDEERWSGRGGGGGGNGWHGLSLDQMLLRRSVRVG